MTREPVPNPNSENWSKPSDPTSESPASRLPGTPPIEDEQRGKQMEREQQMHQIAEQIGTLLGKSVNRMRRSADRVRGGIHLVGGRTNEANEGLTTEAEDAESESMRARISDLRRTATERAAEWKRMAGQRTSEFNHMAGERFADAKRRAVSATQENPIQVILGIAVVSFLIGFGVRLLKSRD